MFVIHRVPDIIHSRIGQSTPLEDILPLFCRVLGRLRFDNVLQDLAMIDATVVVHETDVVLQDWLVDFVTQDAEETVICAADENRSVGGFEALIWHDRRYSPVSQCPPKV